MPLSRRITYGLRPEHQYRLAAPEIRRDWWGTTELLAAFGLSIAIWSAALYAVWLYVR